MKHWKSPTKPVKIDFDCWDQAHTKLAQARAVVEVVSDQVYQYGPHYSDALYAAQELINEGLNALDVGKWRD